METETCIKCDGKGYIPCMKHIDDGVCYTCNGEGFVTIRECEEAPKAPTSRRSHEETVIAVRNDLRAMYRNVRRGNTSWEDLIEYGAYTPKQLTYMTNLIPNAAKAFRALGWPV